MTKAGMNRILYRFCTTSVQYLSMAYFGALLIYSMTNTEINSGKHALRISAAWENCQRIGTSSNVRHLDMLNVSRTPRLTRTMTTPAATRFFSMS